MQIFARRYRGQHLRFRRNHGGGNEFHLAEIGNHELLACRRLKQSPHRYRSASILGRFGYSGFAGEPPRVRADRLNVAWIAVASRSVGESGKKFQLFIPDMR